MSRRSSVLVGLAGVATLLAACSRGLPSDFVVYRGEAFSVAYPGDWKGCHGRVPLASGEVPAVEVSGPAGREQVVPPIIQVANEGTTRKFDHALNFHRVLLQVNPGYKQLAEEDVDVSGARKAVRIEFEQRFPLSVGPGQPQLHGINLLAEAPDGSVISVLASATVTDFERLTETFDDVLRSLAVGSEIDQSSRVSADLPACSTQASPQPSPSPSG